MMPEANDEMISEWLARLFVTVDSKDAAGFAAYFVEQGRFIYGSTEPVEGKQAIYRYVAGFFDSLASIRHTIFDAWVVADRIFVELEVTYEFKDGRRFTLPAFVLFKMEGDLIKDYLIYIDRTPMLDGTHLRA
jgi:hypothetical protein